MAGIKTVEFLASRQRASGAGFRLVTAKFLSSYQKDSGEHDAFITVGLYGPLFLFIISITLEDFIMSSPAITTRDFDHIDQCIEEGKNSEVMNWIVAHEAIEQTILLEYYKKVKSYK